LKHSARWVLVLSGLLGFRVGMVGFPEWQVAVETSQVLAGLVSYPSSDPFFIYHIHLWTLLHQLCAPLLRAGVSEIQLSLALSGVLGMVTFQALAMFVFAFSRDVLVSVGVAAMIFLTKAAEFGVVYGLFLLGTENTYGILGLSFSVLAVALIGTGSYRAGGLLMGVAPAIHPSLGVWTGAFAACAVLANLNRMRTVLRPMIKWFLIGCAVTLASLLLQLAIIHRAHIPATEGFSSADLSAFITYWDGHRKPVDVHNDGVKLNIAAFLVALVWLIRFADDVPRASVFLLWFTLVSASVSIGLMIVSWIPPARLPTMLLVLMPGRVLNICAMTYVALIAGLLGHGRRLLNTLFLLVLLVGWLFSDHSMLWDWLDQKHGLHIDSHIRPLSIMVAVTLGLVGVAIWSKRVNVREPPGGAFTAATLALRAGVLGTLACVAIILWGFVAPRSLIFRDRTNDVFFQQVASDNGLLLTAGDLHLVQLKTRRPVLLDGGGLDGVMYSLQAGGAMKRILQDVYGIDLLHPPEEARGAGRIPPLANRQVWEAYSRERWTEIARRYHVTHVLTYPDWTLNLPIAAQSRRLLLYQIPQ
jgi:hypothetical protein